MWPSAYVTTTYSPTEQKTKPVVVSEKACSGFCWHTQQNQASQSIISFSHQYNTTTKSSNCEILLWCNWDMVLMCEWSKKTKLNNARRAQKKVYLLENLHSKQLVSWERNEEVIWVLLLQHLTSKTKQKVFPDLMFRYFDLSLGNLLLCQL